MSVNGIAIPPISVILADVNAEFNAALLSILLTGLYTCIYIGTMYLYNTRKSPGKYIVIISITVLYAANVLSTSIDWFILIKNPQALAENPGISFVDSEINWANIVFSAAAGVEAVAADVLLIWRCYGMWGCSRRVVFVSVLLLIAETCFFIAGIVGQAIASFTIVFIDVYTVAVFLSFGTTTLTTLLMIYRLQSMWREDPDYDTGPLRTRLRRILELLVQSSAVYAVISFLYAISSIMSPIRPDQASWFAMQQYTSTLFTSLSGMAPTVMVARIALASLHSGTSSSTSRDQVSNIQFHDRSIGIPRSTMIVESTHHDIESSSRSIIAPDGRSTVESQNEKEVIAAV